MITLAGPASSAMPIKPSPIDGTCRWVDCRRAVWAIGRSTWSIGCCTATVEPPATLLAKCDNVRFLIVVRAPRRCQDGVYGANLTRADLPRRPGREAASSAPGPLTERGPGSAGRRATRRRRADGAGNLRPCGPDCPILLRKLH